MLISRKFGLFLYIFIIFTIGIMFILSCHTKGNDILPGQMAAKHQVQEIGMKNPPI